MAAVIRAKPTVQVKSGTSGQLVPTNNIAVLNDTNDLVNLKTSPTFCDPNLPQGIIGTSGRQCKAEEGHPDSCNILCCGRGHVTTTTTEVDQCCNLVYCCYLKCVDCNHRTVKKYYCN